MRIQYVKENLLSDDFLEAYSRMGSPMEELGDFVYTRTYSRYLAALGRREYWWETVRRAVEYNCSLAPADREEAEKLYDNIFHLRQFLSGRTLWVGGTQAAKEYPVSNYNCAFEVVDSFQAFADLFYLLMVGCGVGVRILQEDAAKLPLIRTDIRILHQDYEARPADARLEYTELAFRKNRAVITIGDSKEGWVQALEHYFRILTEAGYRKITEVGFLYDSIRPRGEKLKKFGGTASGHEAMKNMLDKIHGVITAAGERTGGKRVQLLPIDLLDIANIIGENVVSGGVRRTSEIVLVDEDDRDCIEAKNQLYKKQDGRWEMDPALTHRQMSNNSIFYRKKPSRQQLHFHLQQLRCSGEPGWVNEEAAKRRRPDFKGCNPCGEILLDHQGLCNLTTVNVMAFVQDGKLDRSRLLEAQRLSARAAYRMTCRELELHSWNLVQRRDRLLGCSLTGWQDMVNAAGLTKEDQKILLEQLREEAHRAAEEIADQCRQNRPLLVTTIKPEGTLSLLPAVSSGVHYSHAPFYVRRVRIAAKDPLCRVCEELGYPVFPEVGQERSDPVTKVVEFPVKAPAGRVKGDVSALEQLENYKMFMRHYVDHNCSVTVHVREQEWDSVEQWVWDNWNDAVALTFLGYEESFYELLPFEAVSREEYERRKAAMQPFQPELLQRYEKGESEFGIMDSDCAGGVCPVR